MILEMRTYVLKPGVTNNFVERFAEGLTARLQFSKLLGLCLLGSRRAQSGDSCLAL